MQEQPKSRREPVIGDTVLVCEFEDRGVGKIMGYFNGLVGVQFDNGAYLFAYPEELIFPNPAPSIRDEAGTSPEGTTKSVQEPKR